MKATPYSCSFTNSIGRFVSLLLLLFVSYSASSQKQEEQIWFIASELPSFHYKRGLSLNESFMRYVQDSLRLPAPTCRGKVLVNFVVEKDSTISQVKIRQGLENCPNYEEEVRRLLLNMPPWVPGKNGDEVVRVSMSMPIFFEPKP